MLGCIVIESIPCPFGIRQYMQYCLTFTFTTTIRQSRQSRRQKNLVTNSVTIGSRKTTIDGAAAKIHMGPSMIDSSRLSDAIQGLSAPRGWDNSLATTAHSSKLSGSLGTTTAKTRVLYKASCSLFAETRRWDPCRGRFRVSSWIQITSMYTSSSTQLCTVDKPNIPHIRSYPPGPVLVFCKVDYPSLRCLRQ